MVDKEQSSKLDFKRSTIIEEKLGSDNVRDLRELSDGGISITVSRDFSRNNLTALGIDDPSSLIRKRGAIPIIESIIEIPANRLPPSLKVS